MPFRPCCSRVGRLLDPDLCCSCVGRSSSASRRACTPDPALSHRHARPPAAANAGQFSPDADSGPKNGCRRLPAGQRPFHYPLGHAGMTHRDEQSMRRRTKSTLSNRSAHEPRRPAGRERTGIPVLCHCGHVPGYQSRARHGAEPGIQGAGKKVLPAADGGKLQRADDPPAPRVGFRAAVGGRESWPVLGLGRRGQDRDLVPGGGLGQRGEVRRFRG